MVCGPQKLWQMDEDMANELAYGGIAVGCDAPGLPVELGRYGDGDVSDFGHRDVPLVDGILFAAF